jgi:hypothetical protein
VLNSDDAKIGDVWLFRYREEFGSLRKKKKVLEGFLDGKISSAGFVVEIPGDDGKTIDLDVFCGKGRPGVISDYVSGGVMAMGAFV